MKNIKVMLLDDQQYQQVIKITPIMSMLIKQRGEDYLHFIICDIGTEIESKYL